MTTYTYTKPVAHGEPSGVVLYSDKNGRVLAPVFSLAGVPLSGSKLDKDTAGEWPQFTSTVAPLYCRLGNGAIQSINPTLSFGSPITVTGAKGGNVALGNLIAALIAAGVPITDSTT